MIYIIGSEGFLGKKITKILDKKKLIRISTKKGNKFIKTDIFSNIKRKKNEKWIKKIKENDIILLLSNVGSIDFSDKYPNKILNFEKQLERNFLSKISKKFKIIFFSSDMVYSGKKKYYSDNSISKPLNNYGRSKKRIENKIKKYFKKYLILRISKIYSKDLKDKTIYSDIIKKLQKKQNMLLFNNQYVHYLDLRDFLICLKKIIKKLNKINGTYNIPGKFFTTRYQFARKISFKKKLNNKYILPINFKKIKLNLPERLKMKTKLFSKINYFPKYNV
jgi:dTDP-4-dehydrorhamnose reductase